MTEVDNHKYQPTMGIDFIKALSFRSICKRVKAEKVLEYNKQSYFVTFAGYEASQVGALGC